MSADGLDPRRTGERIARAFHAKYEELAPMFGYRTREASAKPWEDVPVENRRLMIATVLELIDGGVISAAAGPDAPGAEQDERADAIPDDWEWTITFTLAAGYDEDDATELYEYVEQHKAVSGAALAAAAPLLSGGGEAERLRETLARALYKLQTGKPLAAEEILRSAQPDAEHREPRS
jgi:hypothetical protein